MPHTARARGAGRYLSHPSPGAIQAAPWRCPGGSERAQSGSRVARPVRAVWAGFPPARGSLRASPLARTCGPAGHTSEGVRGRASCRANIGTMYKCAHSGSKKTFHVLAILNLCSERIFWRTKDEVLEQKRVGCPGVRSAEMVAVAPRNPHGFRSATRILP